MNKSKFDTKTKLTHIEHLLMVVIRHEYTYIATHPNTYCIVQNKLTSK